jgi:hypothetical protein
MGEVHMPREFRAPDFSSGQIELRHDDGGVSIYGTAEGLRRLVEFCERLIESPKIGHIHLEDHQVLTNASLRAVMAIFGKPTGEG